MSRNEYFYPRISEQLERCLFKSPLSRNKASQEFLASLKNLAARTPKLADSAQPNSSASTQSPSSYVFGGNDFATSSRSGGSFNPANSTNHVCRVCAKVFRASSLLDIHMRVHVGAKPFGCPICGHRATQKGNLKLHMKKHHGADLPPHIDLVPDSGIWGHHQENVTTPSGLMADADGKRKQVAQAVSSLLNEEVVELIKKYQNDVGQAATGTITESLEDFIRIAHDKKKEEAGTIRRSNGDKKQNQTVAFSVRFHPYSAANRKGARGELERANVKSFPDSFCVICGKHCAAGDGALTRFAKSPEIALCDACLSKRKVKSLKASSFRANSVKNDSPYQRQSLRQPDNSSNRRIEAKASSCLSEKENFLSLLNLTAARPANRDNGCITERRDIKTETAETELLSNGGYKVTEQESRVESKREGITSEVSAAVQRKASGNVLDALRKSVMSTIDHKNAMDPPSDTFTYRNPAMQNLAKIGQIVPDKPPADTRKPKQAKPAGQGDLQCPYCPKVFKYRSVLEIHLRSHTGERPYKCPHCDYAGTQHNCLKLHLQRHHPAKDLVSRAELAAAEPHDYGNRGNGPYPVNCPVCGRMSPSLGYLKIHMRCHKNSLDHVCHICGRGFKEYWYLSTHLRTHERDGHHFGPYFKPGAFRAFEGYDTPNLPDSKPSYNYAADSFRNYIAANAHNNSDSSIRVKKEYPLLSQTSSAGNPSSHSFVKDVTKTASLVASGSRRRKPVHPSRVVSSAHVANESSPGIASKSVEAKASDSFVAIASEDLPLDLRCVSRKREQSGMSS